MLKTKKYLDASDTGDALCVGATQIIRWAKEQKIPHIELPNGRFRFDLDAVREALNKNVANGGQVDAGR